MSDTDRQRLAAARRALIQTGHFTDEQVGPDIAPRIIELVGLVRDEALKPIEALLEQKPLHIGHLRAAIARAKETQ